MQQTTSTTPAPTSSPSNWRTVREQADRIKASPRSLYRAIRAGQLRAAPINGRGDLRICDDWMKDWLESRAKATT